MHKFKRSNRYKTVAALLLLLVTIFVLGGCSSSPEDDPVEIQSQSFDALRDKAEDIVSDPERANKAVDLITQIEGIVLETQNDRTQHRAEIKALNSNYDATEREFKILLSRITEEQDTKRKLVVGIREKLDQVTTADEWSELSKALKSTRGDSINTFNSAE